MFFKHDCSAYEQGPSQQEKYIVGNIPANEPKFIIADFFERDFNLGSNFWVNMEVGRQFIVINFRIS